MSKHFFTYLLLSVTILACKAKTKEIDFEKGVLTEIIPAIVDSICADPRLFNKRPQLGEYIKKDNRVILDTSLATPSQRKQYKSWLKLKDSLKKDTASIYLCFKPDILPSTNSLEEEFKSHFDLKSLSKLDNKRITISIDSLKLNNHFKFKHDSLFVHNYEFWLSDKYSFLFSGIFEISRITFDQSKNYGILSASYLCNSRCGKGYIIFIKKTNSEWIVDKIKMTWIS